MSGCGHTWFTKGYICFEPETDKDWDRLEELLEELRNGGFGHRIEKRKDYIAVRLTDNKTTVVQETDVVEGTMVGAVTGRIG